MRREVRIAGFGGQGVGLAGYILGKSLALYDGLEAVMTQSYGPEARGGASSSSIVLANQEIAYPFVECPDFLIALSQEAYNKFQPTISPGGTTIIDPDLVKPIILERHLSIAATNIAEKLGARIAANMVVLGYFSAVSGYVSKRALSQAIESTVRSQTLELNLRALEEGYAVAASQKVSA